MIDSGVASRIFFESEKKELFLLCVVTQQIFMERLCASCVLGARDRAENKTDIPSLLSFSPGQSR